MIVTVQLFARARELAAAGHLQVSLPDQATIGDVRREIARLVPKLAGLVERSALALNDDFAADETTIAADDRLALLPPVSGGA